VATENREFYSWGAGKGLTMLMALALLAAIDTSAPPVVELSLTGERGAPVSAVPRTLSDVARERRDGRKAVGGFSAVETTLPRSPGRPVAPVEWEGVAINAEPEAVDEPLPAYEPAYFPAWYGGYPTCSGLRPCVRSHVGIPAPGLRPAFRQSAPLARQPFPRRQGLSAGASGFGGRGTRIPAVTRP